MFVFYTVLLLVSFGIFFRLCLTRMSYACVAYLCFLFIYPDVARLFGFSFHTLLGYTLILFTLRSILVNKEKRVCFIKNRYVITSFWLPLCVVSAFGTIDYSFQLESLRKFFLQLCMFYCFLLSIKKDEELIALKKFFSFAFVFAGVYGVITYILKINPYYLSFASVFGISNADYLAALGDGYANFRGGLSARASGTSLSSLIWGQKCLAVLPIFFIGKKIVCLRRVPIAMIALVLCCVNIFLSGHRSCILPMMLFVMYQICMNMINKKRLVKIFLLFGGIFILVLLVDYVPTMQGYFSNLKTALFFWDDNLARVNNFHGSSKEMRMDQFFCSLNMVKNNILCGLGFEYPSYYVLHHGVHPIMLGFESLFFKTIISSGIVGCFIWGFFFKNNMKKTTRIWGGKQSFAIHGMYLLSILMTGVQNSFTLYLIVTAVLLKYNPSQDFEKR